VLGHNGKKENQHEAHSLSFMLELFEHPTAKAEYFARLHLRPSSMTVDHLHMLADDQNILISLKLAALK
jgi:hypothetical protein